MKIDSSETPRYFALFCAVLARMKQAFPAPTSTIIREAQEFEDHLRGRINKEE